MAFRNNVPTFRAFSTLRAWLDVSQSLVDDIPTTHVDILQYCHHKHIQPRVPPSHNHSWRVGFRYVQGPKYPHEPIMLGHDSFLLSVCLLRRILGVEVVPSQIFLHFQLLDAATALVISNAPEEMCSHQVCFPRGEPFHRNYEQKEEQGKNSESFCRTGLVIYS